MIRWAECFFILHCPVLISAVSNHAALFCFCVIGFTASCPLGLFAGCSGVQVPSPRLPPFTAGTLLFFVFKMVLFRIIPESIMLQALKMFQCDFRFFLGL